jgi:hypothetical protein
VLPTCFYDEMRAVATGHHLVDGCHADADRIDCRTALLDGVSERIPGIGDACYVCSKPVEGQDQGRWHRGDDNAGLDHPRH